LAAHSAFVPQATSAQAEAQQTLVVPLLTHAPLAQSVSAVQAVPSPTGGLHCPPMQAKPGAQAGDGLPVQVVAQAVPTQTYPVAQGTGVGAAHWPAPLHVLTGPVIAAPVHVIVTLQAVVVGAWAQPRLPLQRPVFPQGGLAVHMVATRGVAPDGRGEHLPTFPATLQLSQPPPQAPSQHTPSVQALLEQSEFAPHGWPFGSLSPQRLSTLRQVRPATQSAFDVQVVRHDGLDMLQT